MNMAKKICKSMRGLPKCPKCGKQIDYLCVESCGSYSKNGYLHVDTESVEWDDEDNDPDEETYCCPECNEDLELNYDEAIEFMVSKGD